MQQLKQRPTVPAKSNAQTHSIPWRKSLHVVRASTLLLMLAFFLPWLKVGCVRVDGSVAEEIVSGYDIAWGTQILGEDLQDHKYWLFLISPAAIAIISFWQRKGKIARKIYLAMSFLLLAAIAVSLFYLIQEFFFSEAKPYSDNAIHRFQFYFGNWLGMGLAIMLTTCILLAIYVGQERSRLAWSSVVWLLVWLIALANLGYLFSEFLLDDEPPPARVTYELCYGFWLACAACVGILFASGYICWQCRRITSSPH
jgi:hypothetical protein